MCSSSSRVIESPRGLHYYELDGVHPFHHHAHCSRRLFVGGLPVEMTKTSALVNLFQSHGIEVVHAEIPQREDPACLESAEGSNAVQTSTAGDGFARNKIKRCGKGFAFVTLENEQSIDRAIAVLNRIRFHGSFLVVQHATPHWSARFTLERTHYLEIVQQEKESTQVNEMKMQKRAVARKKRHCLKPPMPPLERYRQYLEGRREAARCSRQHPSQNRECAPDSDAPQSSSLQQRASNGSYTRRELRATKPFGDVVRASAHRDGIESDAAKRANEQGTFGGKECSRKKSRVADSSRPVVSDPLSQINLLKQRLQQLKQQKATS